MSRPVTKCPVLRCFFLTISLPGRKKLPQKHYKKILLTTDQIKKNINRNLSIFRWEKNVGGKKYTATDENEWVSAEKNISTEKNIPRLSKRSEWVAM